MTTTTTGPALGARRTDLAAALLSAALLGAAAPAMAQFQADPAIAPPLDVALATPLALSAPLPAELRQAAADVDAADKAAVSTADEASAEGQDQAASASSGSAAEPAAADAPAPGPRVRNRLDPWESWHRKDSTFNEKLDEHVLRPVATAYSDLVPQPARQAVDNFFGNFSDAWSAVNLFLQGRFKNGASQTMRVAVNSVFGIAGLIDIATPAGLEKTSEDLGRTLGYWGVKTGPYIVWPLLGPSSLRDSVALPVNAYYSPAYLFDDGEYKFAITALQVINTRANLLRVTDMLDGIALDKYTFVRDAYLQRRNIKSHKEQQEDDDDDYEVITPDEKPVNPQGDR